MSGRPVLGIDLGTTFSAASVYRNGRADLVPNEIGQRLTPSVVFFDPNNRDIVHVGDMAIELGTSYPKNCLFDAKRFIGRQYDDEFISAYTNSKQVLFSLVKGKDGEAAYEIDIENEKIIKKPEDVSAEVLKYLKSTADTFLGVDVTDAVISIPAYFSNAQRSATKAAAKLAGLKVLKLITEPTAAAIHYVSEKNKQNSNILVFDFGGGTLDVSVIKVTNQVFQVKAVSGDTLLGGRNFDEVLFNYFYKSICDLGKENLTDRRLRRRLNTMCTKVKEKLSTVTEYPLILDRYDGVSDLNIPMTKELFEELNKDIFVRVMDSVDSCIQDSGLSKTDINEVVLVGGSTRIKKIYDLLAAHFGVEKLKRDLHPDEAVAAGASIHASVILSENQDLDKFKVTEVTPISLGVRSDKNLMAVLIPRNSPLPAEATKVFTTGLNDQDRIPFAIYEGERKNTDYNNKLGECIITGIPKKCAGDVKCTVHVKLDEDGILNLNVVEESTGKTNKLLLNMDEVRLSEKKIKFSVEDAQRHRREDDVFEKFVYFRLTVQTECRQILYNIETYCATKHQNIVRSYCEQFLRESDELDFTEIEKLEQLFAAFKKTCRSEPSTSCRRT
ncbi:hypothetical protein NQ315_001141 [Exocentrus adspersus]|uniref:Heat shock protein 70 n=1 Tax=Exocentrus adspersus TaxID=1586481 RepID=A0AAV8WEU7_9CUCU|nr:hypothetical protein NQ315_001141 [Exocentrus adspersus]